MRAALEGARAAARGPAIAMLIATIGAVTVITIWMGLNAAQTWLGYLPDPDEERGPWMIVAGVFGWVVPGCLWAFGVNFMEHRDKRHDPGPPKRWEYATEKTLSYGGVFAVLFVFWKSINIALHSDHGLRDSARMIGNTVAVEAGIWGVMWLWAAYLTARINR